MMLIELFGLPGSGKTYISEKLSEDGSFVICIKKKLTIIRKLYFLIYRAKSIVLWSYLFKIILQRENLWNKLRRFYGLIMLENYSNKDNRIYIYDQHLFQYLSSFFMMTKIYPDYNDLSKLIKHYKVPSNIILIYNDIPIKIVVERFDERRNSTHHNKTLLDSFNNEELYSKMRELKIINDSMLNILKSIGNHKIIHLNVGNSANLDGIIKDIKQCLN